VGAGPPVAGAWTDTVYMSTNPTWDAGDTVLGAFAHVGELPAGTQYDRTVTVDLPVGVSGTYYFLVRTDLFGVVFEDGATASTLGATAAAVMVNLTPPPDLEPGLITVPATGLAGHGLTVSFEVTNAGAGATPNFTWDDALFLSPTPTYDPATAV